MGDSLQVPILGVERNLFHEACWRGFWEESKKLWSIAGPAIFSRIAMYGMNVITLAFAGHLGDLELAAISIASTVVVGLNFGLFFRYGQCAGNSVRPSFWS